MSGTFTRRRFLGGTLALTGQSAIPAFATTACRQQRGLVILLDFPGLAGSLSREVVAERFRRLSHYVDQMSYGGVCAEFDFTDWLTLPAPVGEYAISPANLLVDKSRVYRLIQDAIDAADREHDFSDYDFVVLFMKARFADYGMIGLCGYPGMLGWQQAIPFRTRGRDQAVPNGVAIFTSSAHLGTLFHDIAHIWGGVVEGKRRVPCLYDHDLQVRHPTRARGWEKALINLGYWDPLSCHFYQPRVPPPGISSWTKLRLGWLPAEKVRDLSLDRTDEVLLGPLETGDSPTLAVRIAIAPGRYFLIENRQPIGIYDSVLPRHGVLVMKADDSISECRHGQAPVRLIDADPAMPTLLGAAFDIGGRDTCFDPETGCEIRLLEKTGDSYRLAIRRRS